MSSHLDHRKCARDNQVSGAAAEVGINRWLQLPFQSVAHKTQAHVLINEPQQMILVLSEVGGKHNGYAGYYVCWKGQQLLFRFDFIYVDGFAFCIQRAIDLHVHAHELLCEFLVIEMVDMLPRG